MSTSFEKNEQAAEPENEACCDSTCSCNAGGLSHKAKLAICLVVALAAVVVVLLGSAKRAGTEAKPDSFAAVPAVASPAAVPAADTPAATKQAPTAVWGPTLSSLASLNEEAADKDAVFVFVPAKDSKQTSAIRDQVGAAAKKAGARDQKVTAYMLSTDAPDYGDIAGQVPPPCVLAMVKGAGAAPVSGDITEAKLLAALVTASRPSSCGPSGCGPTGCN
ncbi:MAG: hypothetical protein KKI08_12610 [Armatimonadetes bacterium]|nr:hypothetical protein [Armatimonadota bacterium]